MDKACEENQACMNDLIMVMILCQNNNVVVVILSLIF